MSDSWANARKHPRRTLVELFAGGFIGIGLFVYFRSGHNAYSAVVTGTGCGLMLSVMGWKTMREGAEALSKPLRTVSLFNVLAVATGVVVLLWGVATSDWGLAAAGLPFIGIGAALMLVPYLINRRRRD